MPTRLLLEPVNRKGLNYSLSKEASNFNFKKMTTCQTRALILQFSSLYNGNNVIITCLYISFSGIFYVVGLGDTWYKGAKYKEVVFLQLCF